MTPDLIERLAAARLRAVKDWPYLATALWALRWVESDQIPTLATDRGWRLYAHPQGIAAYPVEAVAWLLVHECSHLLRDHFTRMDALQVPSPLDNIVTDLEVNSGLVREGKPPQGVLVPDLFKLPWSLLAEEYADLLRDRVRSVKQPKPGSGQCGSCAGGGPAPYELPPDDADAPAFASADTKLIQRQVAQDIQAQAKGRGTVPGAWRRWAEELLTPQIPWQQRLRSALRRGVGSVAGQMDYSFSRLSRRQAVYHPFLRPSLCQPTGHLCLILDTSGSMHSHALGLAMAEVRGIVRTVRESCRVTVLAVDAAVQQRQRIVRPSQVQLVGGGGTDMRVGLEAACWLRPRPNLIVILSDCNSPWPEERPPVPVLVVRIASGCDVPAWAEVVDVPD